MKAFAIMRGPFLRISILYAIVNVMIYGGNT